MRFPKINFETGIAFLYMLFAGIWIWLSDFILALFVDDPAQLTQLQTAKGWVFVLVTTGLLYLILREYMGRQRRAEARLRENEARLRLALYAANQGLFDLDLTTGEAIVSEICANVLG
jgi:PAS domain-containing protein